MKTDGLGQGPASWGRLHPFLLSSLPPSLPAFFFLLHFLSFLVWICLLYALLFLSSGTLFLLLTFFLKHDRQERRAKFLTVSRMPAISPPPPSPDPNSLWTASPYDEFCCYCSGICFGQIYKCSQGTIKNVFSGVGGGFFFFLGSCSFPLLPLSLWAGWFMDLNNYLFSL